MVVGAVVGFYTGGSTWYAMAGSMASGAATGSAIGGMIDPPKGPNITGPRLSDLSQQMASYGAVVPRIYGTAALAGNVFWIENNALKEVEVNESQGGKGGGGSDVTTYAYFATFALGLCQGPADGIGRIWCNGTLIYDGGGSSYEGALATSELSKGIRFYSGSDTQMPDSRMQATLGIDYTPAFRGLCYLVFDDFALADYGNTLMGAQFKVEVIKDGQFVSNIIYQTKKAVSGSSGRLRAVAVKGRSKTSRWMSGYYLNDILLHVVNEDGSVTSQRALPYSTSPENVIFRDVSLHNLSWAVADNTGNAALQSLHHSGGVVTMQQSYEDARSACEVDGVLLIYAFGAPLASKETGARVYDSAGNIVSLVPYVVQGTEILRHAGSKDEFAIFSPTGRIMRYMSGVWSESTILCQSSISVLAMVDAYIENGIIVRLWDHDTVVSGVANYGFDKFDFYTLALIESGFAKFSNQGSEDKFLGYIDQNLASQTGYCDIGSNYGVHGGFYAVSTIRTIGSQPALLGDIIEAECLQAPSLQAGDIDLSSVSDVVRGYRVSSTGSLRASIEPLQSVWPFDVVQSGYKIKFKRRASSTSVATVAEADFDARASGDKAGQRLTAVREMTSQLPARVTLKYLDVNREYDIGEQYAERLNTGSVNKTSVEPPIVLDADDAAQAVEVLLYLYWMERTTMAFALPPSYRHLEPGDIITIPVDGALIDVRLTDVDHESSGVVRCGARPHVPATYVSTATTDSGSVLVSAAAARGGTNFELLDIPVIVDDYSVSGYIAALGRYRTGWTGGSVFRSIDGGMSYSSVATTSLASSIGYATSAIGMPASFGMIDAATAFNVSIHVETLSSVTEQQMLAGANHFAFGADGRWEIIAAQNCVLQIDGSYLLTNILRGRFGTEANAGLHLLGDRLVQLSKSRLQFIQASINQIGTDALFKSSSFGASLDGYPGASFVYRGVNLKPLSPIYLNGSRHPTTNDWSIEWLRRSRIGGEWRDAVDVPLGEAREAYDVEIYSSATYTTLIRTFSGLSSAAATYTSAQQVADFGSNQPTLYVKVYQLSDTVGRGSPLITSISR